MRVHLVVAAVKRSAEELLPGAPSKVWGQPGSMEPPRFGRRHRGVLREETLHDREERRRLVGWRLQATTQFASNPVVRDESRLRICVAQRGDQRRTAVCLVESDDR